MPDTLPPDEPFLLIPPGLADDLRALHEPKEGIEPIVDSMVLVSVAQQREREAVRQRSRERIQRFAMIAAGIAIFFMAARFMTRPRPVTPGAPAQTVASRDFDGNGRVDIVDALRLAQSIESTTPPTKRWDLNGDGSVNRADANTIAIEAVRLPASEGTS